jgi:anthraniloyl-CoA monooxygenase
VAASEQRYSFHSDPASELDEAGIESVLHEFRSAANVAKAAGFQMIEIHMGHGYLLGSFLSPLTNQRGDTFGGTLDNRLRFPLAILSAVRAEGLPVCVALTANDWARKGVNVSDAIDVARAVRDGGCDLIRVLAGQTTVRSAPQYDPYFLTHYADRVRNEAGIATIATGDITNIDRINTIVAGGQADLCLLTPRP